MPPKGEAIIPKPPPRRTKGRLIPASPEPSPSLSQRSNRSDDSQKPPNPNWVNFQGRNSTLNRPLPPPPVPRPVTHQAPVEPALRTSVFDSIKRPPSVAMEKIKSSTAAALDRMVQLQQRYRQHQETMRDDASHRSSISDRNRELGSSLNGSMSSGMDSIPFRPPPPQPMHQPMPQQRQQMHVNPAWNQTPMMQTQSMAQLNFMQQANPWSHPSAAQQQMWMNQQLNRSNMSLNVPHHQGFAIDEAWSQGWGNMYPFPMYPYPGD